MAALILEPTITAQWLGLVRDAEAQNHRTLHEDLESYLVFLLARFVQKPELAASVLAMDYLHSYEGVVRQSIQLQEVGDKCLLMAGLFPERAERKRVKVSYFIELGRSAYSTVADLSKVEAAKFYQALCDSFVVLMDILHATRTMAGKLLMPLQAFDLWHDIKSEHALATLKEYSKAAIITFICDNEQKH